MILNLRVSFSLQYADDIVIFSAAADFYLRNLKCVLVWFENLHGMRINFHKSELIPMHLDEEQIHGIAHIFGCPFGALPSNIRCAPTV